MSVCNSAENLIDLAPRYLAAFYGCSMADRSLPEPPEAGGSNWRNG